MESPIDTYWKTKLEDVAKALEANRFAAHVVENEAEARTLLMERLIGELGATSVAFGGSMTFLATGIYPAIKGVPGLSVIDTFDKSVSREDGLERRRQALLADLFLTGTNAVTEDGVLVNLDMIGNRVAAITFGPKHVVLFVGRNKIVSDVKAAMDRIKDYAAPVNTRRLGKKTPCATTSRCMDCKSPDRICNTWTLTEKSFPERRVHVVLINRDLGY